MSAASLLILPVFKLNFVWIYHISYHIILYYIFDCLFTVNPGITNSERNPKKVRYVGVR